MPVALGLCLELSRVLLYFYQVLYIKLPICRLVLFSIEIKDIIYGIVYLLILLTYRPFNTLDLFKRSKKLEDKQRTSEEQMDILKQNSIRDAAVIRK